MFTIFSVFYVLIAASMIVLILLQRGAGADAGSGFGGGASATVFGARGSASFLTRATAALAVLFFLVSLSMAIYLSHAGTPQKSSTVGLGVMAGAVKPPPAAAPAVALKTAPVAGEVPRVTLPAVPRAPAAPAAAKSSH
jgi:preprotein translocase subunit SecG